MPYDDDQLANLEAELDALVSPDSEEVLLHSRDYDAGIVAAVATQRALAGGTGGTQDFESVLGEGNDAGGLNIDNAGTVTADNVAAGGVLVTGKPGADEDVSYQGGTLSGPPVTGTWEVLDVVPSADGEIHICTVAGTPGTWVTVSGTGSGGGGAADPVRVQDTSYRNGREWWTNFAASADDAVWADITNLTYGTDGGKPAVELTAEGSVGSFFLKDTSVKDFEVMVKWRAQPKGVFSIANVYMQVVGRRLNDNNQWMAQAGLGGGGANLIQGYSARAGAYASTEGATIDNTDSTTYRWIKFRVVGDACFVKHWFDDDDEPDWMIIRRLRPPVQCSGATDANDNQDFGSCGFVHQYGGTIQQVRITELVRDDSNLLISPSPTHIDTGTDGWPIGWYPTIDEGGGDTADVVSIEDPFGDTRDVFHLVKVGVTEGCFWTQDLWSAGANTFMTRNSPHPQVKFPRAVEVSLWSKGNNIVDAGSIASALVAYQYNIHGTILNSGDQFYYGTLGPNGGPNGPVVGGTGKGDGTWDWYRTVWRMPFAGDPETISRIRIDVGMHDLDGTGEIWLTGIELRPVP